MSEGSGACALRSSGTRLLQARLAPGASQITGVQERSISQFGAPTGNRSRSVTRMATFAGRWPSFASHAADVGYSVTRLVEQCADAKLTDLRLALYAGAGSCFSLRTTDGDRP